MHKVRKSSLSPCYSIAHQNKENVNINNLNDARAVSFRALEQARSKCAIKEQASGYHLPKKSLADFFVKSRTPKAINDNSKTDHTKRNKQSGKKQYDSSIDQYRSTLKSKQKQMGSLLAQVSTLNSTILLLKQQLLNSKGENKCLLEQNAQCKKIIRDKNEIIQKLRRDRQEKTSRSDNGSTLSMYIPQQKPKVPGSQQCQKCRHKQKTQQYDQVMEKLNQLEQVQDKLLQQNDQARKKQQMNRAMFKNLKTLIEAKRYKQMSDLLEVLAQ